MRKILISLLILLIGSFFFSCRVFPSILNSESKEVRKAKRKLKKANKNIQKALELAPELVDSVERKQIITVTIPGKTDTINLETVLDTGDFVLKLGIYDSLIRYRDSLENLLSYSTQITGTYEKTRSKLLVIESSLVDARMELLNGFIEDTTYLYEDDYLKFQISIIDGILSPLQWERKKVKIDTIVFTQDINFDSAEPRKTGLHWFGLIVIISMSVIIIFFLIRNFSKVWNFRNRI